jgi:hypothetical protein
MDNLIHNICLHFGVNKKDIAKRKFGKLPSYTYEDLLSRILINGNISTEDVFTEMTRPTISTMLNKAFPGKKSRYQNWYNFLLLSIGFKRCTCCTTIHTLDNFSVSASKFDGLRNECKTCDSFRNKIHREENKQHYINTKHIHYTEHKAEYTARKIKRNQYIQLTTPNWTNMEEMNIIYKKCPPGYHVDHIIPLQGELVCGLHVEHNLQYLSASDNLSKSNKFDIDKYVHQCKYIKPYE